MGATIEDTQREIGQLRGDMTSAVVELERRIRAGVRGVASADVRVSSARATEQAVQRARENPALLGVAGTMAVAAAGYGLYAAVERWRDSRRPQNRLRRRVKRVGEELSDRLGESRRQADLARRGLLLKLDPESGGYMRVTDARLDPLPDRRGERSKVIKKLVWAGLLSTFTALGSVFARRAAGGIWKAAVREEPPGAKKPS